MSRDYRVVLEGAVRVAEVDSADEAVSVAIAKSGDMLNPDLDYVTIRAADRSHGECEADTGPAFVVAGDALVALEYGLTVFNADSEEHAARIARAELGDHLVDVPLAVESVEPLPDEDESATNEPGEEDTATTSHADTGRTEDDVVPDFEDVLAT